MLTFTGTLNLSRFRENWDVVVTNEFHRVECKKINFLNFNSHIFRLSQSKVINTCQLSISTCLVTHDMN